MVHFAEIQQAPSPYSMLQYIGRVAAPKFVPKTCLRYLQRTLIIGRGALVSELMWGIIGFLLLHYLKQGIAKIWHDLLLSTIITWYGI